MKRSQILIAALLVSCALLVQARSQSGNNANKPTAPGPHKTTTAEYDFGDSAANLPGFPGPVEFRASVTYPTNLPGSRHPLVIFLHGRHQTCFQGTTPSGEWPCAAGNQPIPSYHGYDYIAENLASYGYVVVSISANGINAADALVADFGTLARAQLIQLHLDFWNTLNTVGAEPFGSLFVDKIDMQNVGTMGHSRGGEGVVRHFQLNQSLGSPYGIKAVFAVAPTDFNRVIINEVPLAVILPYCDGDVRTLEGVHYYDDSRYNVAGDPAGKHSILVMGADHNFYNTVWTPSLFPAGGDDDWTRFVGGGAGDPFCGTGADNQRLTPEQQEANGLTYVASFFRAYLGGESHFLPLLAGADSQPDVDPTSIHVSYHPPDLPAFRRDVNRFLDPTSLISTVLGGAITQSGLSPYNLCGGGPPDPTPCVAGLNLGQQPHYDSFVPIVGGLSQLITGWDFPTATYTYTLATGERDVLGYETLQFRAGVNFADGRNNPNAVQDLTITLTDGEGKQASVRVDSAAPGSLFFPPGTVGPVPKLLLNTVRIPLKAFNGLQQFDIRQVEFKFDQTPSGGMMITDVAFTSVPRH